MRLSLSVRTVRLLRPHTDFRAHDSTNGGTNRSTVCIPHSGSVGSAYRSADESTYSSPHGAYQGTHCGTD